VRPSLVMPSTSVSDVETNRFHTRPADASLPMWSLLPCMVPPTIQAQKNHTDEPSLTFVFTESCDLNEPTTYTQNPSFLASQIQIPPGRDQIPQRRTRST